MFGYNGLGQFTSINRGTGTDPVVVSTYQYDAAARLYTLAHKLGDGETSTGNSGDTISGYTYGYDAASRITGFTITGRPDESATFNYDQTNQLTAADRGGADTTGDESYDYDANGNRDSAGYATDPHNRTTTDGTFNYGYDAEGNRTSKTRIATDPADDHTVEYYWDHRNRLSAVVFKNNAGDVTQRIDYQYDALDHVIGKLLDVITAPKTRERYVYDGNQIVLSLDGSDGATLGLDRRYLWGPQVDQILAQENAREAVDSAVRAYWTLTDHQNTVRDVLNAVGFLEAHFGYDSFGRLTLHVTGAGATINDVAALTTILYTARPFDFDTGLQINWHRWYDNIAGDWISDDPMSFSARDTNLSRFVGNSPNLNVDPTGFGVGPLGLNDPHEFDRYMIDVAPERFLTVNVTIEILCGSKRTEEEARQDVITASTIWAQQITKIRFKLVEIRKHHDTDANDVERSARYLAAPGAPIAETDRRGIFRSGISRLPGEGWPKYLDWEGSIWVFYVKNIRESGTRKVWSAGGLDGGIVLGDDARGWHLAHEIGHQLVRNNNHSWFRSSLFASGDVGEGGTVINVKEAKAARSNIIAARYSAASINPLKPWLEPTLPPVPAPPIKPAQSYPVF